MFIKKAEHVRHAAVAAVFGVALALGGCAGTVRHIGPAPSASSALVQGVSQVSVQMSPDATAQLADNAQFNREELAGFLRRRLEGKGLLASTATHRVDIVVTDIRVRSAFAAVMFGIMAGNDHVEGRVRLMDASGQVLRNFEVMASYALGGIAGGQDGMRMNWLYDKFSELAAIELEKIVSAPTAGSAPASIDVTAGPAKTPINATPAAPNSAAGAFAALDDVMAVPGLDERGRAVYRDWLSRKNPRAWVIAEDGRFFGTWGLKPKDPMAPRDPLERALKHCRDAGRKTCTAYAVDDQVVYPGPRPIATD